MNILSVSNLTAWIDLDAVMYCYIELTFPWCEDINEIIGGPTVGFSCDADEHLICITEHFFDGHIICMIVTFLDR